ncbi:MAG: MFS transporter, partial [Candidatus Eisenbacteria bacterium]|nr:MFS transporter [Candidatus Eisenbacteria bacterium]
MGRSARAARRAFGRDRPGRALIRSRGERLSATPPEDRTRTSDQTVAPDASPAASPPETHAFRLPVTFRALRSPRYRIFFCGQGVSLLGTWIQIAALNWLVYNLRGSTTDLGFVSLAAFLPLLPFSLLGGVVADRISKRNLLLVTQSILMLQALSLTVLVWLDVIRLWHLLLLSMVMGAANAMDHPTRHAFVVEALDRREDLINAVALNSTLFNLARTIGPALAGMLVAAGGEALAFLINTISYMAALTALALIRGVGRPATTPRSVAEQLREGFGYIRRHRVTREVIGFVAVSAFCAMPFMHLMPAFARQVLDAGPQTYGFLLSSVGVGAVVGGLTIASLKPGTRFGRVFPFGFLGFPLLIILFAQSRVLPLALGLVAVVGMLFITQNSLANTILQTGIEDAFRGRVMSLYSLVFQSSFRLGVFGMGAFAAQV